MKTCVLAITDEGKNLGRRIARLLADCTHIDEKTKIAEILSKVWNSYDGIICIMASGIVVRSIVPLLGDKATDPCVIVIDQKGRYVISLLSGHLGGGNLLAEKIAAEIGGEAVITTASDVTGKTALDLWAKRNRLYISDKEKLTQKSTQLVNNSRLSVYSDMALPYLPEDLRSSQSPEDADIIITLNNDMTLAGLCCIPEILYFGVGCNRDTPVEDIELAFYELCEMHSLAPQAVAGVASIDIKNDEQGILKFAENRGKNILFFSRDELNGVADVSYSAQVMKAVGVKGVAEPAALLAAQADGSHAELIVRKMKWKDVTLAVAIRMKNRWD